MCSGCVRRNCDDMQKHKMQSEVCDTNMITCIAERAGESAI